VLSDVIAEKGGDAGDSPVEILTTFMRWLSNPKLGYNGSMDGWIKVGCLHQWRIWAQVTPGSVLTHFENLWRRLMAVVGFTVDNCLDACRNREVHVEEKYGEAEILWHNSMASHRLNYQFESRIRLPRPLHCGNRCFCIFKRGTRLVVTTDKSSAVYPKPEP